MKKLKQLKQENEEFYPVTVAEAVKISDEKTLADYKLADALDILQSINTIFK